VRHEQKQRIKQLEKQSKPKAAAMTWKEFITCDNADLKGWQEFVNKDKDHDNKKPTGKTGKA
jgi:hypothetical protein